MKKQFIIITSAILVFGLNGCSKHYFDINNNPNTATNTTPELVLPNAMTVTASGQVTNFQFLSAWLGYYGQSGSYATGVGDIASYKQTNTFGDGIWQARFRNLEDYDYVEKTALSQAKPFYAAAAKIMKALVFQQLVDIFNNVPYTQAFQGTVVITPKYDVAQSIYNAITLQVDSAITLMSRADAIGTATSDVMFGGKNALWIQFANSLKLRILLRQTQVAANASFVQAELAKITANGAGFLTADAGVNPGYSNSAGQQNPIWGFYRTLTGNPTSGGGADFWKANQYSIDWLTNHSDPRLKFIYSPNGSGNYVGSVLGGGNNPAGTGASSMGPGILKSVSQPSIIMSAAESYLLQAEADARGWLAGSALTNFNNGVQASFEYLGAHNDTIRIKQIVDPTKDSIVIPFTPDQSAAIYTSKNDKMTNYAVCTNLAEQLACIIRQKWIAQNGVTPLESWGDYRRLHLPADLPISISPYLDIPGSQIPVRILYPISEYQTNAANVNAQGTIDYHASKVFWNQ